MKKVMFMMSGALLLALTSCGGPSSVADDYAKKEFEIDKQKIELKVLKCEIQAKYAGDEEAQEKFDEAYEKASKKYEKELEKIKKDADKKILELKKEATEKEAKAKKAED